MRSLAIGVLAAPLLLLPTAHASAAGVPVAADGKGGACVPSPTPLHAVATPVPGLSAQQVRNAVDIINAGAAQHVPERGQTVAVMTALQESQLGGDGASGTPVFGHSPSEAPDSSSASPSAAPAGAADAAKPFYDSLTAVKNWQNLPPTLAAHAAQHNLDPNVYAKFYAQATTIVSKLTSGSGIAGMQNLAARAQAVADCTKATVDGQFLTEGQRYVGPWPPDVLRNRAEQFSQQSGGWFERCQGFVANLAGRPYSGYATALDGWQTFEANGVAHLVTSNDGVTPPIGAWLYYRGSNPAGHVVTYLGNGQIASTDVFGTGRVGIGPASAITNGPWHLEYLGWAAPWGQQ